MTFAYSFFGDVGVLEFRFSTNEFREIFDALRAEIAIAMEANTRAEVDSSTSTNIKATRPDHHRSSGALGSPSAIGDLTPRRLGGSTRSDRSGGDYEELDTRRRDGVEISKRCLMIKNDKEAICEVGEKEKRSDEGKPLENHKSLAKLTKLESGGVTDRTVDDFISPNQLDQGKQVDDRVDESKVDHSKTRNLNGDEHGLPEVSSDADVRHSAATSLQQVQDKKLCYLPILKQRNGDGRNDKVDLIDGTFTTDGGISPRTSLKAQGGGRASDLPSSEQKINGSDDDCLPCDMDVKELDAQSNEASGLLDAKLHDEENKVDRISDPPVDEKTSDVEVKSGRIVHFQTVGRDSEGQVDKLSIVPESTQGNGLDNATDIVNFTSPEFIYDPSVPNQLNNGYCEALAASQDLETKDREEKYIDILAAREETSTTSHNPPRATTIPLKSSLTDLSGERSTTKKSRPQMRLEVNETHQTKAKNRLSAPVFRTDWAAYLSSPTKVSSKASIEDSTKAFDTIDRAASTPSLKQEKRKKNTSETSIGSPATSVNDTLDRKHVAQAASFPLSTKVNKTRGFKSEETIKKRPMSMVLPSRRLSMGYPLSGKPEESGEQTVGDGTSPTRSTKKINWLEGLKNFRQKLKGSPPPAGVSGDSVESIVASPHVSAEDVATAEQKYGRDWGGSGSGWNPLKGVTAWKGSGSEVNGQKYGGKSHEVHVPVENVGFEASKLRFSPDDSQSPDQRIRFEEVVRNIFSSVFSKWLNEYPADFKAEIVREGIFNLLDSLRSRVLDFEILRDISEILQKLNTMPLECVPKAIDLEDSRSMIVFDFTSYHSRKIAEQLTLVDFSLFKKIERHEFASYLWHQDDKQNYKNLTKFIQRFNQIGYWVATVIVAQSNTKKRVDVLEKLVKIASRCLDYQNYNTSYAIICGLQTLSVNRLKKTWSSVGSKILGMYEDLQRKFGYSYNFKAYREMEQKCLPPAIPIFGLVIKDLTFMNDGNPTFLPSGLINFEKLSCIFYAASRISWYQRFSYSFAEESGVEKGKKCSISEYLHRLPNFPESHLLVLSKLLEPPDVHPVGGSTSSLAGPVSQLGNVSYGSLPDSSPTINASSNSVEDCGVAPIGKRWGGYSLKRQQQQHQQQQNKFAIAFSEVLNSTLETKKPPPPATTSSRI
ncbi:RasGEF [Dinochytrium kinnereticum]|nr:RasGEF [Dinochytrium kinnereticum]